MILAAAATRGGPAGDLPRIVIFGATGRLGRLLVQRFHLDGHHTLSLARRTGEFSKLPGTSQAFDFHTPPTDTALISPGDIVINAAHARFTSAIAQLCPATIRRLIVIGSTRYLTRVSDTAAREVQAAADYLNQSELPWVLLHPTMIYGAAEEQNVQRIAALIRRFHIIPLPGGGQSLIQPVCVHDVVEAVVRTAATSALDRRTFHLGGPQAIAFAAFVEAIAKASGTWVRIIPLPIALIRLAALLSRRLRGIPAISDAEVLRLQEDKDVDTAPVYKALGFQPRSLSEGLKAALPPGRDRT